MTTCFDRWEKDPFFSAAEEVQESADRMESVYRRWIRERKVSSNPTGDAEDISGELRRELHTALGTAKWQLEEFERAVRSSDDACSAGEDARTRHSQFITAIGNQISTVENSLRETNFEEGESTLTWVRLDEGERDELALFLSCPLPEEEKILSTPSLSGLEAGNFLPAMKGEAAIDFSKNSCCSNELGPHAVEERMHGHRRTASASADIGAWNILVSSEDTPRTSSDEQSYPPLPKVLSYSGLTRAVESTSKMKWSKNGFRKWKGGDQHQAEESIPLQNHQLSRGIDVCYERCKSCLSSCAEESYDKQLYGWLGALHRQVQRSQYQIQYRRPIQVIVSVILSVVLIVIFALRML